MGLIFKKPNWHYWKVGNKKIEFNVNGVGAFFKLTKRLDDGYPYFVKDGEIFIIDSIRMRALNEKYEIEATNLVPLIEKTIDNPDNCNPDPREEKRLIPICRMRYPSTNL